MIVKGMKDANSPQEHDLAMSFVGWPPIVRNRYALSRICQFVHMH